MLKPPFLSTRSVKLEILRKKTAGEYVDGWYEEGENKKICIRANVQPIHKKNDVVRLAEGEVARKSLKIYTSACLQYREEGVNGCDGDTFMWDGELYEVISAEHYTMGVLNHTKAIAVRKEVT